MIQHAWVSLAGYFTLEAIMKNDWPHTHTVCFSVISPVLQVCCWELIAVMQQDDSLPASTRLYSHTHTQTHRQPPEHFSFTNIKWSHRGKTVSHKSADTFMVQICLMRHTTSDTIFTSFSSGCTGLRQIVGLGLSSSFIFSERKKKLSYLLCSYYSLHYFKNQWWKLQVIYTYLVATVTSLVTITSLGGVWTPILKPQVRHFSCCHLDFLEPGSTIFGQEAGAVRWWWIWLRSQGHYLQTTCHSKQPHS